MDPLRSQLDPLQVTNSHNSEENEDIDLKNSDDKSINIPTTTTSLKRDRSNTPINAEIHSPNSKRRKLSTQTMNETNENNVENNIKTEQSKSPKSNTNTIKSIQTTTTNITNITNESINVTTNKIGNNKFFDYLSIFTDERCLRHAIPDEILKQEFNERPDRLEALTQMIVTEKWNECCHFISQLDNIPTISDIEGLHDIEYLQDLSNSCNKIQIGNWNVPPGSDTYLVKDTFNAALISAGLVIEATKKVFHSGLKNENVSVHHEDNKQFAVVLNRPPGHHCDGRKYSGYCFINSTAVAIEKQLYENTRVLIFDIDVHHGDGTQKLFYSEHTV
eukprot:135426_1